MYCILWLHSISTMYHYKNKDYKYAYLTLRTISFNRSRIASMSLEKYFICCLSKATSMKPNSMTSSEIFPLSRLTSFAIPSTPKFLSSSKSMEIFHMWCSSDSALLLTFRWNWHTFSPIYSWSFETLLDCSLSCLNLSCNSPIIAPTISLIDSLGSFWIGGIEVEVEDSCNLDTWAYSWWFCALNSLIWLRYSFLSSKFCLWSWEFWF